MKRILGIIAILLTAFTLGLLVKQQTSTTPATQNRFVEQLPKEKISIKTQSAQTVEKKQYKSLFGFSFSYDTQYQLVNSFVALPGNYRVAAITVVRYVHEHFCSSSALSEQCQPLLENPAIAFGVIDAKPRDVVSRYLSSFRSALEPVTIAGVSSTQYYAEFEGEGVVTILVPLKNPNKTLIIQYTYDEIFNELEIDAPILSAAKQKRIVDSVLHTLKIE